MKNIFDSHAHYDDEQFDTDRNTLLSSLEEKGVCSVINCACSLSSVKSTLELAEKYSFVYAALGIHPENINETPSNYLDDLKALIKHKKVVAIGEIGLDYHYDDAAPKEIQKKFFTQQIELAMENNLPVIVHDRDSHEDILNILKYYKPKGVVHCFSGSVEMAKEILKIGMYIGLGGAVTFKNARKPLEVAKIVDDDKLLLETDCPYMSPVPFRGKRNDSSLIPYSAEKIAEIRNCETQKILDLTSENAKRLFNI
ncbi:MAG: TatD family hydrolase [Clostridiales bacterium]|nr:TatD family hydrolase [Clostridiales bacterium]